MLHLPNNKNAVCKDEDDDNTIDLNMQHYNIDSFFSLGEGGWGVCGSKDLNYYALCSVMCRKRKGKGARNLLKSLSFQFQNFLGCPPSEIQHVCLVKTQLYVSAMEVDVLDHEHATIISVFLLREVHNELFLP